MTINMNLNSISKIQSAFIIKVCVQYATLRFVFLQTAMKQRTSMEPVQKERHQIPNAEKKSTNCASGKQNE